MPAATLSAQLGIADPRERLSQQLLALDETIALAKGRFRVANGERYLDPDGHTVLKALELGAELVNGYHSRALSSAESITASDRKTAIAELRAVLEAWEDPSVTDEAWAASRRAPEAVQVAPRAAVVRRKKV